MSRIRQFHEYARPAPEVAEASEAELRRQLAAAYRIFDHLGWTYLIYGHISVRVPGAQDQFLINPFGLRYDEITASNLVKVDVEGRVIGDSEYSVNPAGFIIHSAIHLARPDARCVMHTHTVAGMAMAASAAGLDLLDFAGAQLHGKVAYHEFEGVSVSEAERERLASDLGDRNLMILRNHGLLSCGPTVASAFKRLHSLEMACQVQTAALAMNTALSRVSPALATQHASVLSTNTDDGELAFAALYRLMARKDPSFLD